jgi:hypothetical protein
LRRLDPVRHRLAMTLGLIMVLAVLFVGLTVAVVAGQRRPRRDRRRRRRRAHLPAGDEAADRRSG